MVSELAIFDEITAEAIDAMLPRFNGGNFTVITQGVDVVVIDEHSLETEGLSITYAILQQYLTGKRCREIGSPAVHSPLGTSHLWQTPDEELRRMNI